jgi:predicted lipoprotein with Yx(FWY)xxD motif
MRNSLKMFVPAVAVSLLIAACGSSSTKSTTSSASSTPAAAQTSNSSASGAVVKTASTSLGTTLVDSQGMTLYHLSVERNGKFICDTAACVGVWHPLIASSGGTPSGEVGSLGTVKRPEGSLQVTYKGSPLYTFAQDKKAGETNGRGIKDVGIWSAVTTGSSSASAAGSSSSGESSSSGSESGGGYKY